MPMYKVTLSKRIWTGGYDRQTMFNPFTRRLPDNPSAASDWATSYKEWTFEAHSELHVKHLYEEAKALNIANVTGYELCSVEEIEDHRTEVRGTYRDGAYYILHDDGSETWCLDAVQFMENVEKNDYKVKWIGEYLKKPQKLFEVYVKKEFE